MRTDPKHDAVLECTERHQIVLAPPGAGKTHVSVRLAGHLASTLPGHSRVLLLTFSRQARSQLEREAAAQLPSQVRQRVEITNYHRLFWTAVRSYRRLLDLPMALDIGSRRRRGEALARASPEAVVALERHSGLLESLADHAFPAFRDRRTPRDSLEVLLDAIEAEYRAGFLVFDDLGALFWRLLEQHQPVADAYAERYPIVIADEHQDASALQDAVARRFGQQRLVVLGDTMQLIHEYRGADRDRFVKHRQEAAREHQLVTPHRWERVNPSAGRWLTQVRNALYGRHATRGLRPDAVVWRNYPEAWEGRGVANRVVQEVRDARATRTIRSIAVLVRRRDDINPIEKQLLTAGYFPRRVSGSEFEDARREIEKLPTLKTIATVRRYALERLRRLCPTFDSDLMRQLRDRLRVREIKPRGAAPRALPFLRAMQPIYEHGAAGYLHSMSALLAASKDAGFSCPRSQQARTIRDAAAQLEPGCDLPTALATYADIVRRAAMAPQPTDRGIFLMTAHQSKGKEFDAVVVARFSEERWPDDEETRRLLYVALTRATRRWCFVAPDRSPSPLGALLP
ncbi:ATP-dependent helicase [Conexibacter sp. JD483]|uniref:UvrD-helicase domain-containing protein n=1 Tax=unclassified Conexibacter TaxID=2627773 RepID=UPI00271DCF51|nr:MULTISPECIES: ATP-dependent helicase [unclassified Conexibacter]MDO8184695.1 ATP-dependent helicase [Conexibacter sp. CPCC 205706]MDO8198001.1 ATP-dependent helicase [Conexibacter sp. CPCC 205762]MDR9368431.1 ATP-dependent helicase [Conexibacter sp. JD483]